MAPLAQLQGKSFDKPWMVPSASGHPISRDETRRMSLHTVVISSLPLDRLPGLVTPYKVRHRLVGSRLSLLSSWQLATSRLDGLRSTIQVSRVPLHQAPIGLRRDATRPSQDYMLSVSQTSHFLTTMRLLEFALSDHLTSVCLKPAAICSRVPARTLSCLSQLR